MPDPYLPGHGNPGYRVVRYELELDYKVAANRLSGRAGLGIRAEHELPRFSLDLHGLTARRVSVAGRPAAFRQRAGKLHVQPARAIPAGAGVAVEVRYGGNPRPLGGPWGDIGWDELTDGALVASQPVGAPTWFPCNDHPSDKASYRITVTTDAPYTVSATGVEVARRRSAGTRTWVFDRPEPTASYLVSVQIGRYDEIDLGRAPVPQLAAVPPRLRRAFARDFARQGAMLETLEGLFGPYPFRDYRVVVTDDDLDDPIEAQGMSIFGANHVDGKRTHERLVVHELAHQWFGNSLTIAAWPHIWLNEGFATYAEWLWSQASGGRSAAGHANLARVAMTAAPRDLVLADPGVHRMFDQRVYRRGALLLHALRGRLGDDGFFGMVRAWTDRHRYGSVTTELFEAHAADHSGVDLAAFFDAWLRRPALPPP